METVCSEMGARENKKTQTTVLVSLAFTMCSSQLKKEWKGVSMAYVFKQVKQATGNQELSVEKFKMWTDDVL